MVGSREFVGLIFRRGALFMSLSHEPNQSASTASSESIKQRVLTQTEPSVTAGLFDAKVIKDENIFLLTQPDGSIPLEGLHGLGLYLEDMRYLDGYCLSLNGRQLISLAADCKDSATIIHQLTNPRVAEAENGCLENQKISLRICRKLDGPRSCLQEEIELTNFLNKDVQLELNWQFHMDFKDVFVIRGLWDQQPGRMHEPEWDGQDLYAHYEGTDGYNRGLTIRFDDRIHQSGECAAKAKVSIAANDSITLSILYLLKKSKGSCHRHSVEKTDDFKKPTSARGSPFRGEMEVVSDDILLNHSITRSLTDLSTLRSHLHGDSYIAAGLPWFGTLFGRDSVITAMQMLAYDYRLAKDTLRILSRYQGQNENEFTDEQPGKILHEYRTGELAQTGRIPHTPFYGTIDATPLFLILVGQYCRWSGDLAFFHEIRHNVEAALEWMQTYGDTNNDGFLDYESSVSRGLINQGWKDAGNSILNAKGQLPKPPITVVEFQGYAYRAKLEIAELLELCGETEPADQLRREAKELKADFHNRFWMKAENTFAMGFDGDKHLLDVVSSNPTHCLWTEMIDEQYAQKMRKRYFEPDIYSGWGVRTLSSKEIGYNPVGYHLGTVWPHDNAFFVAGLKRYGYREEAVKIFDGFLKATMHFENQSLPELFSGFSAESFSAPVPYPVACHPQAWASGALPFMLSELLGLQPNAFDKKLKVVDPVLPSGVTNLRIKGLQVAGELIELVFHLTKSGNVRVEVGNNSKVKVEVSSGR